MFSVDGDNYLEGHISNMMYGSSISEEQRLKRKFLYIEGLIRFLQLYGANEIGCSEVNIEKVALWVNSPCFENVSIRNIKSIKDVYKYITADILHNIPLYRFLKLTDSQLKIMEKEHYNELYDDFKQNAIKYPCLDCAWYHVEDTNLGRLSQCNLPREDLENKISCRRTGYHDITTKKNRNCKYHVNESNRDEFINNYVNKITWTMRRNDITNRLDKRIKLLEDKINNLDNSYIPIIIPKNIKFDINDLDDSDTMLSDLGRVFNNKKTIQEMKSNLRKAIFLRCIIEFVEIYAQSEIGNDYVADIYRISKYVYTLHDFPKFKSEQEIYEYIESLILSDDKLIYKFIKRKEL